MNNKNFGRRAVAGTALLLLAASVFAAESARRPISIDDLLLVQRVGDVQISPDGQWVAYTVGTSNLDTNQNESNVWLASTTRAEVRQLTRTGKDRAARWSPDGTRLAFLSRRDGKSQAYVLPIAGGEAQLLTKSVLDFDTLRWAPDGNSLVLTAQVYPDCEDEACNKARDEQKTRESNARVYEQWPYTKAMAWMDAKRSHLFSVSAAAPAAPKDLTPRWPSDIPHGIAIDGSIDANDIAISPDGAEVCFVSAGKIDSKGQVVSQIFRVPMNGGNPTRLGDGAGNEKGPVYSPDGRFIAFRANPNPANTGRQAHMMLFERASGKATDLTPTPEQGPSTLAWSADGRTLLFLAEQEVLQPIFSMNARQNPTDRNSPGKKLVDGYVGEMSVASRGTAIAFARSSFTRPAEIFVVARPGAAERQVTRHNDALIAGLDLPAPEMFWFESKDSTRVQAMLLRPPGLRADAKVPLLVLLHGGPHTTWQDSWSPRWNSEVFAAPGRAVLIVNRRGSTGYGQRFSDAIVKDWGGGAYDDVMTGLDAALARYTFLDGTRVAAAGASYGGYMANWLATHTDRFKTIVSHAGVYDMLLQWSGDIPWFLEYELGGESWSAEGFRKWSPSTYAEALGKYKTPMLITVGEKDYRVPYQNSLELFATLQRQGVPSKLMVFPDAGHWIAKPKDVQLWYSALQDWLAAHL
jgi:dipeptidyl aminopeptidase/acylaminoacyl peptidase